MLIMQYSIRGWWSVNSWKATLTAPPPADLGPRPGIQEIYIKNLSCAVDPSKISVTSAPRVPFTCLPAERWRAVYTPPPDPTLPPHATGKLPRSLHQPPTASWLLVFPPHQFLFSLSISTFTTISRLSICSKHKTLQEVKSIADLSIAAYIINEQIKSAELSLSQAMNNMQEKL